MGHQCWCSWLHQGLGHLLLHQEDRHKVSWMIWAAICRPVCPTRLKNNFYSWKRITASFPKSFYWPQKAGFWFDIPWGYPGTLCRKSQGEIAQRMSKTVPKDNSFLLFHFSLALVSITFDTCCAEEPWPAGSTWRGESPVSTEHSWNTTKGKENQYKTRAGVLHTLIGRQRGRLGGSWSLNISIPVQITLLWKTPRVKPKHSPTYKG